MKKIITLLTIVSVFAMLVGCSKDVSGDYKAFNKNAGIVEMSIYEEDIDVIFSSRNEYAEIMSSGLFAPDIDTSMNKLTGKIDSKKKEMKLRNEAGDKVDVTYEVDGDKIIMNIEGLGKGITFYKEDTDEYKEKSSKFDEESVINNMSY
ncbi:hypothetical protein [Abyssicoccus albus]|uniref:Uncharacterized protein n=1 Tax=Abyssicoccus albus TaxID=1817405 RepID=A0A3N5BZB7_9BACL|nr:hypothetical protein [Abyssicoccus albus]RPF55168.1 hypothetical protein EDD62_1493 [Abyssicoccus albus]